MATIHRTAVLEGDVEVADDAVVGPNCVILGTCGPVKVGSGCVLVASVHLNGPLTMGERNTAYPGACLGFAPQDVAYDPNKPGLGAVIGSQNTFREGFTLHRGKTAEPTRVGDRNYFMANSHVGHDTQVASDCILANGCLLAGHVEIAERVVLSGNTFVHQFCRVGRGAMFTGGVGASLDVPPWFMITGTNVVGSMNIVGMRRNGFPPEQIRSVRWVYRTIYRSGQAPQQAMADLQSRGDDPVVAEYIAFIRASKRGIAHGAGRSSRGQAGMSQTEPAAAE